MNVKRKHQDLGDNSVGVRAGDVSGNVILRTGTIEVQGGNSAGVSLNGDIGGALAIQNTIQNTGYRYTQAPADPSKLDETISQGGSALVVAGDVGGGILFDAKPKDNDTADTDEDDDGIADASDGDHFSRPSGRRPRCRSDPPPRPPISARSLIRAASAWSSKGRSPAAAFIRALPATAWSSAVWATQ